MLPSAKGLTLEVTGSHRFEPLAWAVPNHFSTQILFWTRTSSLKWAQGSSASCFSLRFFCSSPSSGAVSAFSYCDVQEEGINSANLPTAMLIARTWLEVPREVFSWTASNSFSVKRPKKHNIIIIIILLNCLFRSSSFCNLVHGYKVRLHMATDRFMPFPICFPTISPRPGYITNMKLASPEAVFLFDWFGTRSACAEVQMWWYDDKQRRRDCLLIDARTVWFMCNSGALGS